MSDSDKLYVLVNKFTEESVNTFREEVFKFAEYGSDVMIPVYIDSYGGFVDALVAMIDIMDSMPNPFMTICVGKAMSCGAVLLSHGDIRYCAPNARVMVHNVSSLSFGNVDDLQLDAEQCRLLNKRVMGILADNCGMTYNELRNHIKASKNGRELYLSARQAIKFGLVDKIGVPVVRKKVVIDYSITTT